MLYELLKHCFKVHFTPYVFRKWSSQIKRTDICNRHHWESVVGLEIHAQISSFSKLFSGASTYFYSPVNSNVSLFDAAIPGTLPVLNQKCVEAAVLTSLALSCRINPVSLFDRKHYFYADLPAGYQITQQRLPIAQDGEIRFHVFTPGIHKKPYSSISRIKQLQLEQDSGRSLHDKEVKRSLVDLNRAGIPLMELVFEPDLKDGEEAAALVKELILILQKLKTCSCKMEEGALRVDANVSVHKKNEPFGVRTEIKNIGSIRGVASAIEYEIQRQIQLLENGETVVNETRSWDALSKKTLPMRDKEEKQDYRFMPEPNLPPLRLNIAEDNCVESEENLINVAQLKRQLPELPEETRQNLIREYQLSPETTMNLVSEDKLLNYFHCIMNKQNRDPRKAANILVIELLTVLNKHDISLEESCVKAESLGDILDLLQNQVINLLTARKLLTEIVKGNSSSPSQIIEEKGWSQITDPEEIKILCVEVLSNNKEIVEAYHSGKIKVFGALLGIVARETNQRADMAKVSEQLKKLLSKK